MDRVRVCGIRCTVRRGSLIWAIPNTCSILSDKLSGAYQYRFPRLLKMAEASVSKKRKRGNPNRRTGLIGVCKNGKKYRAKISYGGTSNELGIFDTKEQAGMAYDRFVVDKSTKEVSFTLNYPNGLPSSGTNKEIKQEPEAELILNNAAEDGVHVKSEPEAEF